jgi:hypothetical protein
MAYGSDIIEKEEAGPSTNDEPFFSFLKSASGLPTIARDFKKG